MKKILVTTDFSAASKAGVRFAIQLATQMDVELVFFHCFQALIPTTIHRERMESAVREQTAEHLTQLERFVARLHRSMQVAPGAHHYVVREHLDAQGAILEYAHQHDFQFICMSTHGAGALQKIIGTNTGWVLQRSSVPVLVVPHTYRVRPIQKILYASDLENFDREMPVVSAFAEALQVKTDLAHLFFPGGITLDPETLTQMWRIKYPQLDQVYLRPYILDKSFPVQLDALVKRVRPSLVVFFTHTKRTWFDKVFGTSRSELVSFVSRVPMLVCRKTGA